jgi:hypothetical protein
MARDIDTEIRQMNAAPAQMVPVSGYPRVSRVSDLELEKRIAGYGKNARYL